VYKASDDPELLLQELWRKYLFRLCYVGLKPFRP